MTTDTPPVLWITHNRNGHPRFEASDMETPYGEPWVPQGAGVRVKPLEFTRSAQYLSSGPYLGIWRNACTRYPVAGWEMRFRGHISDYDLGTYSDPEEAIAVANRHNEARIRAALELTTEPEPTSGAYDLICCTAEDVVQGREFTGDPAADLATAQESLRACLEQLRWRG